MKSIESFHLVNFFEMLFFTIFKQFGMVNWQIWFKSILSSNLFELLGRSKHAFEIYHVIVLMDEKTVH